MAQLIETPESPQIRATDSPICALCGSKGQTLYADLSDRLFAASGQWTFKSCPSPECGLIWLDPMPLTEDLGKAYLKYYTHASRVGSGTGGLAKRIYRRLKRGYWGGKYGYPVSFVDAILGRLMYFFPTRRSEVDADARFLRYVPNGRVLDVGCGSGDWLVAMQDMGWQVAGLDFDENAVKTARDRRLDVRLGALEQQEYPDASFDAVILNHVIEHVPDPKGTLMECARILKPGGKLILFTPNTDSLSHRIFKQDWRGLEPPRHLHVFSYRSLPVLCRRAGFVDITARPQVARSVIYESLLLRWGVPDPTSLQSRNRRADFFARLGSLIEIALCAFKPSAADCVAVIAVKH